MLLGCNLLIRVAFGLVLNEPADTFPQLDHASDAVFRRDGDLHREHPAVFPVVHLPICNRVAEILHCGVGRDGAVLLLFLPFLDFVGGVLGMEVFHGFRQQVGKVGILQRLAGGFLFIAVHTPVKGHLSQQHFWVIQEILVDRHSVLRPPQVQPL